MSDTVIAALIGVIGTTFVAILSLFGREVIEKLSGTSGPYKDMRGFWKCEWYISTKSANSKLYVSDAVEIKKINGWKVEAEGHDAKGKYYLTGRRSPANIMTLLFESRTIPDTLTGVVILKLGPWRDSMEGYWYGYTQAGEIQGGKVIWQKSTMQIPQKH